MADATLDLTPAALAPLPARRPPKGRPFEKGNQHAAERHAREREHHEEKRTLSTTLKQMFGADSRVLLERINTIAQRAERPNATAKDASVALQANTVLLAYQQGKPREEVHVEGSLSSAAAELALLSTAALQARVLALVQRWPTASLPPALAALPAVAEARQRASSGTPVVEGTVVQAETSSTLDAALDGQADEQKG